VKTVLSAKRVGRIVAGFALLGLGIVLLALPGPGALTIALGLGMLATEFAWARRLLTRFKNGVARMTKGRWPRTSPDSNRDAPRAE
jgi:uncharacterized protein (TIGR02611 family)